MTTPTTLSRYLHLTQNLRPRQIVIRGRLRGQRSLLTHFPSAGRELLRGEPLAGDWPTQFVPFDGSVVPADNAEDELRRGQLTLLGHTRTLHLPGRDPTTADWTQAEAPLLWRYHLHYWDWAWTLTHAGDPLWGRTVFADLYLSWSAANPVGKGVAWSPYVASLRAWALCGLGPRLARGSRADGVVRHDLGVHRSFLRRHLETDVGGNHLLKNLKALVGLALAAGSRPECRRWVSELRREVSRQVLADGGHYERSPAYHCQVLADLDDIVRLLAATGMSVPDELAQAVPAMRRWLSVVLGPDGKVPLLNDGYPVSRTAVGELLPGTYQPARGLTHGPGPTVSQVELLADSGLAVMTAGPWHVLADVGPPCPDELPAHAHADTLSFLLWHDGMPILVDTGTSTYEPGPRRDAERGTAAHSTVVIDGVNSTDVWGAFRAGRRARPQLVRCASGSGSAELVAWHDGYRYLPGGPRHQRTWQVRPNGVSITDRISGSGRHRVEILFQFTPETEVTLEATVARRGALRVLPPVGRPMALRTSGSGTWRLHRRGHAVGWNQVRPTLVAGYLVEGELPVEVTTELSPLATSWSTLVSRPSGVDLRTRPAADPTPPHPSRTDAG